MGLLKEKVQRMADCKRLEKNYTKEEIITMYFNKFDFLNNAVGINSASQVYFGKTTNGTKAPRSRYACGNGEKPFLI